MLLAKRPASRPRSTCRMGAKRFQSQRRPAKGSKRFLTGGPALPAVNPARASFHAKPHVDRGTPCVIPNSAITFFWWQALTGPDFFLDSRAQHASSPPKSSIALYRSRLSESFHTACHGERFGGKFEQGMLKLTRRRNFTANYMCRNCCRSKETTLHKKPAPSPTWVPCNIHAAITMHFGTKDSKNMLTAMREHAIQIEAATTVWTTPSLGGTQLAPAPHTSWYSFCAGCANLWRKQKNFGKTAGPGQMLLAKRPASRPSTCRIGSQTLPKSTSSSKGFEKVSHRRA